MLEGITRRTLPLLVVFGAFSWYPIVRTVVMSFQHTNLVEAPTWVGFDNFRAVWNDPQFPIAVKTLRTSHCLR